MKRISHDLPGVTQRIGKLADEFEVCCQETLEVWRDEKGRSYIRQHTSDVRPTISQLTTSMARTIELFEEVATQFL